MASPCLPLGQNAVHISSVHEGLIAPVQLAGPQTSRVMLVVNNSSGYSLASPSCPNLPRASRWYVISSIHDTHAPSPDTRHHSFRALISKHIVTGTSSSPNPTNRRHRPVRRRLGIRCGTILLCRLRLQARPRVVAIRLRRQMPHEWRGI